MGRAAGDDPGRMARNFASAGFPRRLPEHLEGYAAKGSPRIGHRV